MKRNLKLSTSYIVIFVLCIYALFVIKPALCLAEDEDTYSFYNLTPYHFPQKKKRIKILSIDGGGIRGIIPAIVLKYIEDNLKDGQKLTDCFNVMAGSSTGGLIVLLLNTQDSSGKSKYEMNDILQLYKDLGDDIFEDSVWQKIKSFFGWFDAKYSEKPFENLLKTYFGDEELKSTITNVLVSAYEIEQDKNFFFRTIKAKEDPERNFKLKDIARAITAAPTYFKPAQIHAVSKRRLYTLIDGGVSANNPTISAMVHAIELYGFENDFLIVSLGTGTNYGAKNRKVPHEDIEHSGVLGWAGTIVPLMMYSVNDITDYEMSSLFGKNGHSHKDYFRLQIILEPENSELDNISASNIKILEQKAKELITKNKKDLDLIIHALNEE